MSFPWNSKEIHDFWMCWMYLSFHAHQKVQKPWRMVDREAVWPGSPCWSECRGEVWMGCSPVCAAPLLQAALSGPICPPIAALNQGHSQTRCHGPPRDPPDIHKYTHHVSGEPQICSYTIPSMLTKLWCSTSRLLNDYRKRIYNKT